MNEELNYKCNHKECTVAKDGKCVEGYSNLEDCPHHVLTDQKNDTPSNAKTSKSEESEISDFVQLASGDDLDVHSTAAITGKSFTHVIVLAGAVGSGKTTLLACIYEKLLRETFTNYIFAGSQTLIGFDKRCQLARIVSERNVSNTERTKRGFDDKLLHLQVRRKNLSKPAQDLLFSDISGETFEMARDSTYECQQLKIIKRADHFALVIDGEKLSKTDLRHSAMQDADMLLRRCIEANMLTRNSYVDILFTKYDVIKEKDEKNRNMDFIEHIKTNFKNNYEEKLGRLRFSLIAARPKELDKMPLFYGLEDIFPIWVEESPFLDLTQKKPFTKIDSKREFDKFSIKNMK